MSSFFSVLLRVKCSVTVGPQGADFHHLNMDRQIFYYLLLLSGDLSEGCIPLLQHKN